MTFPTKEKRAELRAQAESGGHISHASVLSLLDALDERERDFCRVVYLGNRVSPLNTAERDELNSLLAKAYRAMKESP